MNFAGLSVDNISFPDRKSIVKSDAHLDNIIDKAKNIDVEKVNFDGEDFLPKTTIIQKQKVYFWMRLFINEEIEINPETKINIVYDNGKETLESYFMYFGKKGLERNKNGEIINFNPEDDKRILCLLIDKEKIDVDSSKIPYLRTLFPLGRFFTPQYIRKSDFSFIIDGGQEINFYDIEF